MILQRKKQPAETKASMQHISISINDHVWFDAAESRFGDNELVIY